MSTKTKKSLTYWILAAVCMAHVVGFLISEFRDDVQGMVWYGFTGALWFSIINRERDE